MKIVVVLFLSMIFAVASNPVETYGALLKKYVNDDGVDYKSWHANKSDREALKGVTHYYATTSVPKDHDEGLSFYLNAYNAWILDRILAKYPTKGPISGADKLFFHKKAVTVAGKKMSFDKLEQKIIRPEYKESRIHFALNCASKSCPSLRAEPYIASELDKQLNEQTYKFLHDSKYGVKVNGSTVQFSKIFEWYAEDFGGKDNIPTWVRYYRKLSGVKSHSFMKYDWSLNEQ